MRQIGEDATMFDRRLSTHMLKRVPLILMLAVGGAVDSRADPYPAGNIIRIVAPTGPGAPPDAISRVIATEISEARGWRVVVENRPGALQTIAIGDVLKRPADGLSIFPMSVGAMAVPVLLPDKGLHFESDFAPVVGIATPQRLGERGARNPQSARRTRAPGIRADRRNCGRIRRSNGLTGLLLEQDRERLWDQGDSLKLSSGTLDEPDTDGAR